MSTAEPPVEAHAFEDVPPLPVAVAGDASPEVPTPRPGCALPAIMGCGCLTLLTGVGFVLMVVNARGLLEWQLRPLRRAVESGLPAGVEEAERQRFARAFDALPDALTSGTLDPGTVWRFQRQLAEAAAAGQAGNLDRQTAMELLDELERVVAEGAGEPEPEREPLRGGEVEASADDWRESPFRAPAVS